MASKPSEVHGANSDQRGIRNAGLRLSRPYVFRSRIDCSAGSSADAPRRVVNAPDMISDPDCIRVSMPIQRNFGKPDLGGPSPCHLRAPCSVIQILPVRSFSVKTSLLSENQLRNDELQSSQGNSTGPCTGWFLTPIMRSVRCPPSVSR
jgi:hypothetical protein